MYNLLVLWDPKKIEFIEKIYFYDKNYKSSTYTVSLKYLPIKKEYALIFINTYSTITISLTTNTTLYIVILFANYITNCRRICYFIWNNSV